MLAEFVINTSVSTHGEEVLVSVCEPWVLLRVKTAVVEYFLNDNDDRSANVHDHLGLRLAMSNHPSNPLAIRRPPARHAAKRRRPARAAAIRGRRPSVRATASCGRRKRPAAHRFVDQNAPLPARPSAAVWCATASQTTCPCLVDE